MPLEKTTVNHTQSFDVINGETGVAIATRELFKGVAFENQNLIEGFRFMNTFIASNEYTGGFNSNVQPTQITQNNPAGTYRSTLMAKGSTDEFPKISGLADIKFGTSQLDEIILPINKYIRSGNPVLIYPIDVAQNSWLVSGIESAVQGRAISALVRQLNYETYNVIKNGAAEQIDPEYGAQGRVIVTPGSETNESFTNGYIEAIAKLGATPKDRYITGIPNNELVGLFDPLGQAKILEAKLQLFDGLFMGEEGRFFTGLPYTHRFAGTLVWATKYFNDGKSGIEADYAVINPGRWSPFLFHTARFAGWAEKANFTDGAIGIYGTAVYGMKAENKLTQYLILKVRSTTLPDVSITANFEKVYAERTGTGAITVYGTPKAGSDVIARLSKVTDAPSSGVYTKIDPSEEFTGLESGTEYRVEIAAAPTTTLVPGTMKDSNSDIGTKEVKVITTVIA